MLIGLIGAAGLVGKVVIKCLQDDLTFNSELIDFKFYTRESGCGLKYILHKKKVIIEKFLMTIFEDNFFDFIILATENDISSEIIGYANRLNLKTKFIDLSSEFRLQDNIPLVIPEVNPEDLNLNSNIISSPNCTTTFLVMLLKALEPLGIIRRVIISTYQSASGAGTKGIEELKQQTLDWFYHKDINKVRIDFWKKPLLFNVFSHNSSLQPNLYNSEEMKIIKETQKIFHRPDLKITPTCVRVPVLTSHCESINVEFDTNILKDDIINKLENFPGIKILDNCEENKFPEPFICSGINDIYVGRIRPDLDDMTCWNFFVCGDQLIKGSGLNAVQILANLVNLVNSPKVKI
jgi:aspartate-semialdehyde dehydrogenase